MINENQPDLSSATTLVLVDDDTTVLQAISWALDHAGFRCFAARHVDAAVELLRLHAGVAAVMLDRGVVTDDLAAAVSRLRRAAGHGLIIGTSGGDCRGEFLDAGADAFLPKPWTTKQVVSLIEHCSAAQRHDAT